MPLQLESWYESQLSGLQRRQPHESSARMYHSNVSFQMNERMNECYTKCHRQPTGSSSKNATRHCALWPTEPSLGLFVILLALCCWELGTKCSLFITDYVHGWYCWVMVLMSVMNTSAVYFLQIQAIPLKLRSKVPNIWLMLPAL